MTATLATCRKPEFTYEAVNRASKACGPLVKWVIAQIQFADMLMKIGPLRGELGDLESSVCQACIVLMSGADRS